MRDLRDFFSFFASFLTLQFIILRIFVNSNVFTCVEQKYLFYSFFRLTDSKLFFAYSNLVSKNQVRLYPFHFYLEIGFLLIKYVIWHLKQF